MLGRQEGGWGRTLSSQLQPPGGKTEQRNFGAGQGAAVSKADLWEWTATEAWHGDYIVLETKSASKAEAWGQVFSNVPKALSGTGWNAILSCQTIS